jgi:hypothetical protein
MPHVDPKNWKYLFTQRLVLKCSNQLFHNSQIGHQINLKTDFAISIKCNATHQYTEHITNIYMNFKILWYMDESNAQNNAYYMILIIYKSKDQKLLWGGGRGGRK